MVNRAAWNWDESMRAFQLIIPRSGITRAILFKPQKLMINFKQTKKIRSRYQWYQWQCRSTRSFGWIRNSLNRYWQVNHLLVVHTYIFGQWPTSQLGLLLLFCCGLHVVWAIFQFTFFKISTRYIESLDAMNSSVINKLTFHDSYGYLLVTISAWYFGIIIGCGIAGYYLLSTMRKRYIYVSLSTIICE